MFMHYFERAVFWLVQISIVGTMLALAAKAMGVLQ